MRDAAHFAQLRALAALQEVLTADATAELADARDAERQAAAAARAAVERVDDVAAHWYRHLDGSLMPERGRAIAALLVERERAARQRHEEAHQAGDHAMDRERRWRAADAAERATDRVVGRLRRHRARKAEERALDALADRVTIAWMTR